MLGIIFREIVNESIWDYFVPEAVTEEIRSNNVNKNNCFIFLY